MGVAGSCGVCFGVGDGLGFGAVACLFSGLVCVYSRWFGDGVWFGQVWFVCLFSCGCDFFDVLWCLVILGFSGKFSLVVLLQ